MRVAVAILTTLVMCATSGCSNPPGRDENGRTPLMRAAQAGNLTEVQRLANKRTINDQVKDHSSLRHLLAFLAWMQQLPERKAGWTALTFAADSGRVEVVQELLRRGADPNLGSRYYRPLSVAIRFNANHAIVEALLKAGARIDSMHPPPLQAAAAMKDSTLVRLLLNAHAPVDSGDRETPLITATRSGSLPIVEMLLRAGANVNARDKQQNWSALDIALANGRMDIVNALLQAGADRAPLLNRELVVAIEGGDYREVERLLKAGANPNATDEKRRLALTIALSNKREDIAFALLRAGAIMPGQTRSELLYTAAFNGADSVITVLLGDTMKPTPTHLGAAAAGGHASTVRLLLKAGADARGEANEPLWDAMRGGNGEVVQALIDAGADAKTARRGETPLEYSVRVRATDITPVLIAAGADAVSPTGSLPMIYTPIVYEDTVTAALLLEHGADINARDMRGQTTLDHAMRLKKKTNIIRFLESRGALRGDTALVRARPTR